MGCPSLADQNGFVIVNGILFQHYGDAKRVSIPDGVRKIARASYDCPQVWTLRRFRDDTLADTIFGRAFIRTYYAISPTIVRLFGERKSFRNFWRKHLDGLVGYLQQQGVEDTPYLDKQWRR